MGDQNEQQGAQIDARQRQEEKPILSLTESSQAVQD
jgi:hypothetical protein